MPRKRREDYLDCGTLFSDWKILVAQSLPEELRVGGSYELGVLIPNQAGGPKGAEAIKSWDVLPVYLGDSERNLKAALARYGYGSSHIPEECLEQVSEYGASLVFRCAKDQLEMKEELLQKLDYAWNARGNSCRRPADVDRCLQNAASGKESAGTNLGVRVESVQPGCFFVERSDKTLAELLQWMKGEGKETSLSVEGGEELGPTSDWRKFLLPIPTIAKQWRIDITVCEGKGGRKFSRSFFSRAGNSCSVTSSPRVSDPGGDIAEASWQTRYDAKQATTEADLSSTASTFTEESRTDGCDCLPTLSAVQGATGSLEITLQLELLDLGPPASCPEEEVPDPEIVSPTTGNLSVAQGADDLRSNIRFSFGDSSPGAIECEASSSSPAQCQPDVLSRSLEDVEANLIDPSETVEVEDISRASPSFLEESKDITCHNIGSESSGTSGELEMKSQKLESLETATGEHSRLTPIIHMQVPRRVLTPDRLDTIPRSQASGLHQLLLDPMQS